MTKNYRDIRITFGNNLKRIRKKQYTQEQFAECIGIETANLSKIECGKVLPRADMINRIANVLNIKPYLLFISEFDIDIDSAYEETLKNLEKLKKNPELFKRVYDFVSELTREVSAK